MRKIRVGVIFGGRSGEHEVSLMSARSVMDALDKEKYEVVPIGITRQGRWVTAWDPWQTLQAMLHETRDSGRDAASEGQGIPLAMRELVPGIGEGGIPYVDVIFPVLHGPYGEDGTLQGLLELAGIPYVGSGVLGSALGMDKAAMKAIFRAEGLPVADYVLVMRWEWEEQRGEIVRRVEQRIGYPCFVKPANLGSSVGVSKVQEPTALPIALDIAARYDRKMLVEKAIDAREIECSVLGNDHPIASLPGEVVPGREFYDYEAKYFDEATQLIVPADLPPSKVAEVQELAVRAFLALDCAGMARADFFLDRQSGQVYINELNTIPGFTAVSMYPRMWEASGIPYPELLDRLIQLAFERHRDRSRISTLYRVDGY
ncbi:MAG: D-alanine--D-alanine ligase [Chloroflexi bacterium]|nr:D-alanine--D-alanine ligase [Chloroflexota bacterium]